MSQQQETKDSQVSSPEIQKARKYSTQTALALELPFTIVGAVLLGGVLGYFLDHWLHTKPVFIMILGGADWHDEKFRSRDGNSHKTRGRKLLFFRA